MRNERPSKRTSSHESRDAFIPTTEAMQILGLSRAEIKRRIADGEIRAKRMGLAWLIPRDEIDRLLQVKAQEEAKAADPSAEAKLEAFRRRLSEPDFHRMFIASIRAQETGESPA